MTTISEEATVDEGHLVPALKAQCIQADTNLNVNPQNVNPQNGNPQTPTTGTPNTANVNPQGPVGHLTPPKVDGAGETPGDAHNLESAGNTLDPSESFLLPHRASGSSAPFVDPGPPRTPRSARARAAPPADRGLPRGAGPWPPWPSAD